MDLLSAYMERKRARATWLFVVSQAFVVFIFLTRNTFDIFTVYVHQDFFKTLYNYIYQRQCEPRGFC